MNTSFDSFERVELLESQAEANELTQSFSTGESSQACTPATQQLSSEEAPYLEATLDKASLLSHVLSPLNFQKDAVVIIAVLSTGLKFTVEEARVLQATAFLSYEVFGHYALSTRAAAQQSSVVFQFAVALNPLCECLNIFGTAEVSTLKLVYQKPGMDLFLILAQAGVITNVALRTLDTDGPTPFYFRHPQNPLRNKLIIQSEHLKAAFNELDWSNSDIQLIVSPEEPFFKLSTVGPAGSCEVEFSRDSATILEFESFDTQVLQFKLKYLQPAVKALSNAKRTQIKTNLRGTLNLMHMIDMEDGNLFFIEFYLLPSDD